jgi:hypothetical protein
MQPAKPQAQGFTSTTRAMRATMNPDADAILSVSIRPAGAGQELGQRLVGERCKTNVSVPQ